MCDTYKHFKILFSKKKVDRELKQGCTENLEMFWTWNTKLFFKKKETEKR